MQIYYAPLEGITGYLYRNLYQEYFGTGIDKYFTPFIVPSGGGYTKHKSMRDILPENNEGMPIVPQLLSNNAEDFLILAEKIKELGYEEVNLNLGCPYRTVVSKGRGSGFLGKKQELKEFLDAIFEDCDGKMDISIKTRIGMQDLGEWEEILELYNRYPMKELIIHPRLQKEFYSGTPHKEAFELALAKSKNPLCYNGDIFTKEDYLDFTKQYPQVDKIMIGRGFLVNPGLYREITGGEPMTKEEFKAFHDRLYKEYRSYMGEDRNTHFKMKELWHYMQYLFVTNKADVSAAVGGADAGKIGEAVGGADMAGSETAWKYIKKIRKSVKAAEYEAAVNGLLRECEIREGATFEG